MNILYQNLSFKENESYLITMIQQNDHQYTQD